MLTGVGIATSQPVALESQTQEETPMFNKRIAIASALSVSSAGIAAALAARGQLMASRIFGAENIGEHIKHAKKAGNYRSRGAQAKPKKRRNMVRHSQRVRRAHRKAA